MPPAAGPRQRDPLLVAKQAATIHHLSGGRLTLGVGVGWIEQKYTYLRSDFRSRGQLADEYIPAMRALLETRTPEFHGAHIDYSGVLFSPRPSTPIPIVVGGTSRAALKRAATLGDGWHGIWQSPGEVLAALATMDEFGRKSHFQISLRTKMRIGETARDREAGAGLRGDTAALAKQIQRYASAGVDQLVIEPIATELHDFLDQMTQFARKVMSRPVTSSQTRRRRRNVRAALQPGTRQRTDPAESPSHSAEHLMIPDPSYCQRNRCCPRTPASMDSPAPLWTPRFPPATGSPG